MPKPHDGSVMLSHSRHYENAGCFQVLQIIAATECKYNHTRSKTISHSTAYDTKCIVSILVLFDSAKAQTSTTAHVQTLEYLGTSCSLEIPANFSMTKKDTSVGPVYSFSDSTKEKSQGVTLMVSIVPTEGQPSVTELLDGVLDPFKSGLKNYKAENQAATTINGNIFENRHFSGNFPKRS
jgi:hypothetical protein